MWSSIVSVLDHCLFIYFEFLAILLHLELVYCENADISISSRIVSNKIYDKWDNFDFDIVIGKGSQKYKWILSKSIWKTEHFDANCMKIGFLRLKILWFFVFKMAANGSHHFEINIKIENYETQIISQKHAYIYFFDNCNLT